MAKKLIRSSKSGAICLFEEESLAAYSVPRYSIVNARLEKMREFTNYKEALMNYIAEMLEQLT